MGHKAFQFGETSDYLQSISETSKEILEERTEKFKNVGYNIPADVISFDHISQFNIKNNFKQHWKKLSIVGSVILLIGILLFF